jgi:multisubunit Na+/H+ antiporter MnhC subunit
MVSFWQCGHLAERDQRPTMNWKRALVRLSIVLTVLWAFASFYIASGHFSEGMEPYWGLPDWKEHYDPRIQAMWIEAIVRWAIGVAILWGGLFTGI